MAVSITPSLENYLKTILQLQQEGRTVRVTDLARRLGIAKSSVNQAVGTLKKRGLVIHERYGPLELSQRGTKIAQEVKERHDILLSFLTDVLDVDQETAENDACLMEHAVSGKTMERLSGYIEDQAGETIRKKKEDRKTAKILKGLDEVLPGTRVRVIRVESKSRETHRLREMGLTPGSEITVEGYAPMGDPIDIKVRGYNLAVRKSEARNVLVEVMA